MAQAVYNFLGFSINEIRYINERKSNSYINISIVKDNYNEELSQYTQLIKVASDFSSRESIFIFQTDFKINDEKWFESLDKKMKKSVFFSISFPFIREKIFSITSDTNPGLFMPTLDIRNVDLNKEIKLIRKG